MNKSQLKNSNNEDRWKLRFLETELYQLRREHQHITEKSSERELSIWEQERLEGIFAEISDVLGEIEKSSGAYKVKAA